VSPTKTRPDGRVFVAFDGFGDGSVAGPITLVVSDGLDNTFYPDPAIRQSGNPGIRQSAIRQSAIRQ
jgi:hypothetical protein